MNMVKAITDSTKIMGMVLMKDMKTKRWVALLTWYDKKIHMDLILQMKA